LKSAIENQKSKIENPIDWQSVKKILVVRLRSIGDTVLSTPSLIALRRFLPDAQIDILLENWVAPVLQNFDVNVVTTLDSKLKTAWQLNQNHYDVVFNLHGGSTSTFLTFATQAKYRVGYSTYRYANLHTHLLSSSADFWQKEKTHSAEQQLALLGFIGVPVEDKPKSKLIISDEFTVRRSPMPFALLHPIAAFETKQWATKNFAEIAEFLMQKGLQIVAVGTKKEREVLDKLRSMSSVPIQTFDNLSLPQITKLASQAKFFIGNDSGIAHIAAAVETPSIVIFGSSNIHHWSPWTNAPHEIVYEKFDCQPCAGYVCEKFDEPKCILSISVESVTGAIERVIEN
jgi:lipopolysaccharide heptosyltransferase II